MYPGGSRVEQRRRDDRRSRSPGCTGPFLLARAVVYVVAVDDAVAPNGRVSVAPQDDPADAARARRRPMRLSVAFIAVFAVTFSLASFDWVMALDPGWYSTISGIYPFAGLVRQRPGG